MIVLFLRSTRRAAGTAQTARHLGAVARMLVFILTLASCAALVSLGGAVQRADASEVTMVEPLPAKSSARMIATPAVRGLR